MQVQHEVVYGTIEQFYPRGYGYLSTPIGPVKFTERDLGFEPCAGDTMVVLWREYQRLNGSAGRKVVSVLLYVSSKSNSEYVHTFDGRLLCDASDRPIVRIVMDDFCFELPLSMFGNSQCKSMLRRCKTRPMSVRCEVTVENGVPQATLVRVLFQTVCSRSVSHRAVTTS